MATFNFPNAPTDGQVYSPAGGPNYKWSAATGAWKLVSGGAGGGANIYVGDNPPGSPIVNQLWWKSNLGQLFLYFDDGNSLQWVQAAGSATGQVRLTARTRNRLRNSNMQVSQENGSTTLTANGYPADQWNFQTSGFTGPAATRVALGTLSPDGAQYALALNVGTAKGALAAGDYLVAIQPLEGLDIADLGWGAAGAKPIVIRFNVLAVTAGTYGFSIHNGATANRCYCGSFTVTAASTWQTISLAIPGDVTGTWAKDTSSAWTLLFSYAAGSTFTGIAGWQAGNFFAPSGCINPAATANATLYITDVAMHSDPDNTGLPPPFVAPPYEDDLQRCCRYWQKGVTLFSGNVTSGSSYTGALGPYAVTPRAIPSIALVNQTNTSFAATVGTTAVVGGLTVWEQRVANASGVGAFGSIASLNARLI